LDSFDLSNTNFRSEIKKKVFDDIRDDFVKIQETRNTINASQAEEAFVENRLKGHKIFALRKMGLLSEEEFEKGVRIVNKTESILSASRDNIVQSGAELVKAETSFMEQALGASKATFQTLMKPLTARINHHASKIAKEANNILDAADKAEGLQEIATHGMKQLSNFVKNNPKLGEEMVDKLRGDVKKMAEEEAEAYTKALKELHKIEDAAKFEAELANILSPSFQYFVKADVAFKELREAEEWGKYSKYFTPAWITLKLQGHAAQKAGKALQYLEVKFGKAAVTFVEGTASALSKAASGLIALYANVLAPIVEISVAINNAVHAHNFLDWTSREISWFTFGILDKFAAWNISEFTNEGSLKVHEDLTLDHPSALNFIVMDAENRNRSLDFWGEAYTKLVNIKEKTNREYKKAKKPKVFTKVPPKYIPEPAKPNPPLVSQADIDESRKQEELISGIAKKDTLPFFTSLCSVVFPRRNGFLRNLAAFPTIENTNSWPNPDGVPVVQDYGNLESAYDPEIVRLMKHWVQSGNWGPVYNTAKSEDARRKAAQKNKTDLQKYLNFDPTQDGIIFHMQSWADGPQGQKVIFEELQSAAGALNAYLYTEWNHYQDPGVRPPLFAKKRDVQRQKFLVQLQWIDHSGRLPAFSSFRNLWPFVDDPKNIDFLGRARHQKYVNERKKTIRYFNHLKAEAKAAQKKVLTKESLIKLYLKSERRKGRTLWTYIHQPAVWGQMVQELQYHVHVLSERLHSDIWERYTKLAEGTRQPLSMNAYHRARYLGDFSLLAYEEEKGHVAEFYDEVQKVSKGVLEDIVVSTSSSIRSHAWYTTRITELIHAESTKDIIAMLGDITCRIFVLNEPRVLILAFKGTSSEKKRGAFNWVLNTDFLAADFITPFQGEERRIHLSNRVEKSGIQVHDGFLRAWLALEPYVRDKVNVLMRHYKFESVFCTGHSLGAALATLASMSIPSLKLSNGKSIRPLCYTFASPRVGNASFLNAFRSAVSEAVTVWIDGDVITVVPPLLWPSQKRYGHAYYNAINDIIAFSKKKKDILGLSFNLLGHAIAGNLIPDQLFPDGSGVFKDGKFDFKLAMNSALDAAEGLNKFSAVRGADIFMRLGWKDEDATRFKETPNDPGNSKSTIEAIAVGLTDKDKLIEYHSLANILDHLDVVVQSHPDLFDPQDKNLPTWFDGGGIDPDDDPGGPSGPLIPIEPFKPKGKDIREKLVDILERPGTRVIGFAHHKRKYVDWSVVDPNDVDETSALYFPEPGKDYVAHIKQAKKRRARSKKDITY